ncbi:hypothetical protein [Bacteroides sp. 51]|uniref:hypothetical protein n=1 Tax=Bacteroides sp. 51 TaxID=2302938 RepID=UPI0013D49C01|nr:hypothetical protein [Bacteroides sp. 51]NDV84809.1 hypothetical protein [Bacteroides sp. 51]
MGKDKFYTEHAPQMPYSSTREWTTLNQVNPKFSISINENWEWTPGIDIYVCGEIDCTIPKSTEWRKYKRIIPEIFESYYSDTLRFLQKNFLEDAEYFIQKDHKWYRLYAFTDNKSLSLSINNGLKYFNCQIEIEPGRKGRNTARKKYDSIAIETFKQAFQLTIEFCYDRDSFLILKDDYFNQITQLLEEEKPISGLILNADMHFNSIREQLQSRIKAIENRMISFDDEPNKRSELRGELNGLRYCVNILDKNR